MTDRPPVSPESPQERPEGAVRTCVTITQHSSLTAIVWAPPGAPEAELRELVFAETDADDWEMDYGDVETHEVPEGTEDAWEHDSMGAHPPRAPRRSAAEVVQKLLNDAAVIAHGPR